jgi:REP element-mobilizing transposase RayT
MTYPRAHLIDTAQPGFYHIVSRCVRRSFLCGIDPVSGHSYEHRRSWIEARLLHLASLFSLEVYAYAVMRNHYHLVVRLNPTQSQAWSKAEIAQRWVDINPPKHLGRIDQSLRQHRIQDLLDNPMRLHLCRQRLSSLSWYMRFLNHPIACRANQEDHCRGHFWEARYKSFALLDETAIIACMAYVDLNPIRAKTAVSLVDSDHTSIKQRLRQTDRTDLAPLPPGPGKYPLRLSLAAYVAYLQRTGLIPATTRSPPDARTRAQVLAMASYQRAYGATDTIELWLTTIGQRWSKSVALP